MLHQAGGLEGLWGGGKEQMRGDKGQRSRINNCCKSCSHGEALQQVAIQHATNKNTSADITTFRKFCPLVVVTHYLCEVVRFTR